MRYCLPLLLFLTPACSPKTAPALPETTTATAKAAGTDFDLTGNWAVTMTTPRGERTNNLRLTQEGNGVTATTRQGEFPMTLKGDKISWSTTRTTPRGEMTLNFSGTVVDNNTMSGTMSPARGNGDRSLKWTAKRVE